MRPTTDGQRHILGRRIVRSAFFLLIALVSATATAHPLGNFSVNRFAGLHSGGNAITISYIIDMAEIPAYQEIQESGITAADGDPSLKIWLPERTELLKTGLLLTANAKRLRLVTEKTEVTFPPGAGGLPTLRIEAIFRAPLEPQTFSSPVKVDYRDTNFPDNAGWKEIVVTSSVDTPLLDSTAPSVDRSRQLTFYPVDIMKSPPRDLEAHFSFSATGAGITNSSAANLPDREVSDPQLRGSTAWDRNFIQLIAVRQLSVGGIFISLVLAFGLGAFHALEPGHGKTLVASYLIGSRGTANQAILLGIVVTATHTAGVYLLGFVTLYLSRYLLPEQIYPWLSLTSGLVILAMGVLFLSRSYRRRQIIGDPVDFAHHYGHSHLAGHSHPHTHDDTHHRHDHGNESREGRVITFKELGALGITGGMVPCPAALVVLLSAVSFGRVGFGLALIVAFSAGLSVVLIIIGLMTVSLGRFISLRQKEGVLVTRWLPIASSIVIIIIGVTIAFRSLTIVI